MKLQFAFFESIISFQIILVVLLFISINTNSSIFDLQNSFLLVKQNIAIADIANQFNSDKALQNCFLLQKACAGQYLEIYENVFQLPNITIRVGSGVFGDSKITAQNCFLFEAVNQTNYQTGCIGVG